MRPQRLNQQGYNLVELMIAVGILAAIASSVIAARSFMAKQVVRSTDKAYATQKAIQMFEELKALVNGAEKTGINVLDSYSDGSQFNQVLTTDKTVDVSSGTPDPSDPLSGNKLSNGHYRYLRQTQIINVANNPYARQVIIKVWRFASDQDPNSPGELLSEVGGMLTTISTLQNPTQVYDIYLLSINNIQGWWSAIPGLYTKFVAIIGDIQNRNPGLEIRAHYITRSSYGRDTQYAPYINATMSTTQTGSIPWIYFYPGLSPQNAAPNGSGKNDYFYDPGQSQVYAGVRVDGTVNIDGNPSTTDEQFSKCPIYPTADMYNNSMRYPDEAAMHASVSQAGATLTPPLSANNPITEISERMLIEGMLSNPANYKNALIINLHGELLPLPPMRNYSDPAKSPGTVPHQRIVTHPENIFYPFTGGGTTTVNLRVYGYYDGMYNPDINALSTAYPATTAGQMPKMTTASVFLPGLNPANPITAVAITGDAGTNYAAETITSGVTATNGMSMTVITSTSPTTFTQILLYNTPLRCPQAPNGSGLNLQDRLYRLEYIPCSPERTTWSATNFTAQDLTNTSAGGAVPAPKNTARWVLKIPLAAGQQEIDTSIGSSAPTTLPNAVVGPNQSRTYVWCGGDANAPPWTERYEFLGDARHCPYLDVKTGGPSAGGVTTVIENDGYNWYFKNGAVGGTNSMDSDGYHGFDAAGDIAGWGQDSNYVDVPRLYQMIRTGLLNTTSIWTTMNGWSYYYYGFGGEMGSDQPPYNQGITMIQSPWSQTNTGGTLTRVAEMINYQAPISFIRVASDITDHWYAKTWLGELYPDEFWPEWSAYGNLPTWDNTGSFITRFYRKLFGAQATNGSQEGFGRNLTSRTGPQGCGSFYNGMNGGGKFDHQGVNTTANLLQPLGNSCYSELQYPLALAVNLTRPWQLNESTGTNTPSEWSLAPYSTYRTALTTPSIGGVSRYFYDNGGTSGWNGNGVVKLSMGTTQTAYVIESGLAISANVGTDELGKTGLVCLFRTFWDGGLYSGADHISQLPLIKVYVNSLVNQFNNPTSIGITISSPVVVSNVPITNIWFRYPGITSSIANYYTDEYTSYGYPTLASNTYGESVSLDLNLKYSKDGGTNWFFIGSNNPAQLGVRNASEVISAAGAPITYGWDVSNAVSFAQGSYLIRSEVYRQGFPLDYSYHVLDVSINR